MDRNWVSIEASFEEYTRITGKYTFGWMFETQFSTVDSIDNYQGTLIYLPAFEPLFDSQTYFLDNYRAQGYIALGMKHLLNLTKNLDFRFELYAYRPFRRIRQGFSQETLVETGFRRPSFLGMAALIYNTLPGPLSLRLNYIEDNSVQLGLMLSFGYLIFNKKSFE